MFASLITNIGQWQFLLTNPLSLLLMAFQLWMLVHAIRNREWLWAVFIVIGWGLSAVLYYFLVYRNSASATSGFELPGAQSRKRIKVAASLTIAEQLMPRWLVSLQAAATRRGSTAPEVILTATNSDHVISAVRDGAADLGFIESPGLPIGLRSSVVARDELVAIVPPDHKWARRSKALSAYELSQTSLVARELGSGTRDSLTAALRSTLGDAVEQARPVLELSSAVAVRGAVLAGAGPAVMSRLAVADDLAVGRLRAVDVPELNLRRELRAIWVGGRTPPAGAIRDLLSHIRNTSAP